ncbi:RNA helicase [Trypanosoma rangeli]|uniref:RNA helicase n=1 Tax=Trypanosoma rangeli TaxID=5698 RepID=A0A3R7N520_TRYRA|nr:RNA helicase [Trypanosoma rangeli]RNF12909.1 RNA helicase [Trypanosoma rangeli]|eukprot:RNF12909.1 RNA helicase [Trypanosoma rangeli]
MDMSITVQLVFAPTGCQFPVEVKHPRSSPVFTSSSLASSSPGSFSQSSKIFVSDIVSCVNSCKVASPLSGDTERNVKIYVELFDYTTLRPLLTNEPVVDGQKLLLFVPALVADSLAEQLLHQWGQTAPGDQGIHTDEKERWKNLRQAILALNAPQKLHQELMEKEMEDCVQLLEFATTQLNAAKENIPHVLAGMKDMRLFYDPEVPLTSLAERKHLDAAVRTGEKKLQEAATLLESVQAMVPAVIEAINAEAQVSENVEKTPAWKTFLPSTMDGREEVAVTTLMYEVDRKVQVVLGIVENIVKLTKQLKRCRHYASAVLNHVVEQHNKLCLLPQGMEAAKEVVHRRIILRRAIRRMLVPLEVEYHATERIIHKFTENWSQLLPDNLYRAVSTPLPPLYPPDDFIANDMDRLFLDVEDDETERLLNAINASSSSKGQCNQMTERSLKEAEEKLQRCETVLENAQKENTELEELK